MGRAATGLLQASAMPPKRTVYILRSLSEPARPYIGLTHDVRARLADHNAGRCPHTARYRPWQLTSPSNSLTSSALSTSNAI